MAAVAGQIRKLASGPGFVATSANSSNQPASETKSETASQ